MLSQLPVSHKPQKTNRPANPLLRINKTTCSLNLKFNRIPYAEGFIIFFIGAWHRSAFIFYRFFFAFAAFFALATLVGAFVAFFALATLAGALAPFLAFTGGFTWRAEEALLLCFDRSIKILYFKYYRVYFKCNFN